MSSTSDQSTDDFPEVFTSGTLESYSHTTEVPLWKRKKWIVFEITSYSNMWFQVFFWLFIFTVLIHVIVAVVAFYHLRQHKFARLYALAVLIVGFLSFVTGGAISSAVIAWICYNSTWEMKPFYAMMAGLLQSVVLLLISFSTILATL